ncbi:MAG: DNA-deoxyinosine glycosylase [Methylophilaceae bacterium]|nr:DNA-deoxyinosine glycosylase [Methylophilaceae bacterium]
MATADSSHRPIVHSFAPVARADAKWLILGSMPGQVSLAHQQYYAHARNLFWPLMGELFGAEAALPYALRLTRLQENGIALWDVLQQCERANSLDADIVESSIVTNDFASFFAQHKAIRRICFNGNKAEQAFRRYVLPGLSLVQNLALTQNIELIALPSTSPANASIPLAIKRQRWMEALSSA